MNDQHSNYLLISIMDGKLILNIDYFISFFYLFVCGTQCKIIKVTPYSVKSCPTQHSAQYRVEKQVVQHEGYRQRSKPIYQIKHTRFCADSSSCDGSASSCRSLGSRSTRTQRISVYSTSNNKCTAFIIICLSMLLRWPPARSFSLRLILISLSLGIFTVLNCKYSSKIFPPIYKESAMRQPMQCMQSI